MGVIDSVNINGTGYDLKDKGGVRFDEAQTLSDAQKLQAQTNIGAMSPADVAGMAIRYDAAQSLQAYQKLQAIENIGGDMLVQTEAQSLSASRKSQARTNIGAASDAAVVKHNAAQDLTDAQKAQARTNIGAADASDVTALDGEVDELKSALDYVYADIEGNDPTIGLMYYSSGGVISSTSKWTYPNTYKHVSIPVSSGDDVALKAGTPPVVYAFLNSNAPAVNGATPDFCTGYESRVVVNENDEASFTIPNGCNYLYLAVNSSSYTNQLPISLKINGVEKIYNIKSKIQTLAPINSPQFTGTPTTPTASSDTNNMQIASTAFVRSRESIIDAYLKKQMFESANFGLDNIIYTDEGYLTLGTGLQTTHTNFVWLRDTKDKNIISVPVKFNASTDNARICVKDTSGTIIYVVLNVANGYYKINAYTLPAVAVLGTPINTNIAFNSSDNYHMFRVVLIGYTVFLYFDDSYVGKIDCTNKIGSEIDALGFGFRGNTGNNSYYGTPEIHEVGVFTHFSFDDQLAVFKDLTDNASTYTSIFDNSALAGLKALHDTYGCVFTLMLFYQDNATTPTFTLNDVTTKFKNEFTQNSGWLKMAYHGPDPSTHPATDMTTQELVNSVKAVYDAVETFAGACCIDKVPRISYFNCTHEQAVALKEAGYIQGLLTADDTRTANCGLDSNERAIVQNYDMYTDYSNDISYFRTELRIDDTSIENLIIAYNNLFNSVNNHKQFVIFGHGYEGTRLTKLQTIAEWCFKHNMKFDYPVNNLGY